MRVGCSFIVVLLLNLVHLIAQESKADTSIVVENFVEITTIKKGSNTRVYKRCLEGFWDNGVDTVVSISDCVKKVELIKLGFKETTISKLPCYWDQAKIDVDTILLPDRNRGWSFQFHYLYTRKSGESKTSKFNTQITKYNAYRAGLDSAHRKEYNSSHKLFKLSSKVHNSVNSPVVERDTTVNKILVLEKINSIRANSCFCGNKKMNPTHPLRWSDKLTLIAYLHAKDMFVRNFLSHDSPEGDGPGDRLVASGYAGVIWSGENVLSGAVNAIEAIESWKTSSGHCRNMMNPKHCHVGVAKYMNKYVMLLGKELNQ
jgi:uncharacterized protein YkwD